MNFSLFLLLIGVISNKMHGLTADLRNELERNEQNNIMVITIKNTDTEIMKQVVIFMYTAKCDINKRNGKIVSFYILMGLCFQYDTAFHF